jgi:hypothetical protein
MDGNADIPAQASSSEQGAALEKDDLTPKGIRITDSGDESAAATTQAAEASTPNRFSSAESASEQAGPFENEPAPTAASRPILVEVGGADVRAGNDTGVARRASYRVVAGLLLILAMAAGGWFVFPPNGVELQVTRGSVQEAGTEPLEPATDSDRRTQPDATETEPDWDARIAALEQLRAVLLAKAREVRQLQQEYRFGVMEVEEELVHLIKRHGLESFSQALRNRQVELGLRSIQSRQAYAAGLATPLRWLAAGSEELLFVKRLVELDLEVLPFAEGVDMDAHALRIDALLRARQPTPDHLAMAADEPAPSLEAIWKRLTDRARQLNMAATERMDAAIAEEACAGDLTRIAEVAVLRLKAARCLAESGAKELFLNRLSELPAAAAQKLSEWPGSWLCVNGLKQLSPETARHLFAWPGRQISLNGLSEISAAASAGLPDWGGQQLELMGLKKVEAIEHLVRFEEAGGKLFLPPDIRRQVDAWRRSSRQLAPAGKEKR